MASTTTTTTGTTPESTTSTTTVGYYPYDYWTNPDYRYYWMWLVMATKLTIL